MKVCNQCGEFNRIPRGRCARCNRTDYYQDGGYPDGIYGELEFTQMEGGDVMCKRCALSPFRLSE